MMMMMIHKVDDSVVAAEFVDYRQLGDTYIQDRKLCTRMVHKRPEPEVEVVAVVLQLHYKMVHLAVQQPDKDCYLECFLVEVKV